jgi:hypothetical protein
MARPAPVIGRRQHRFRVLGNGESAAVPLHSPQLRRARASDCGSDGFRGSGQGYCGAARAGHLQPQAPRESAPRTLHGECLVADTL